MPNVEKITKQTENPFVNLYLVEGTNKVNHHFRYYVASRAKSIEQMKIKTRKNTPDGVLMYSLYGEKLHLRIPGRPGGTGRGVP